MNLRATCEDSVEFLEKLVGCVRSAMDDRIIVFECNVNFFILHELGEMLPVVRFAIKFESVIKLVHLNAFRVVSIKNLGEDPTVR